MGEVKEIKEMSIGELVEEMIFSYILWYNSLSALDLKGTIYASEEMSKERLRADCQRRIGLIKEELDRKS